jgi:hypothetical protein
MLFDLRGRGRRRTVQVIYASLAILMGGGLVLFGIGGDTQGGLFDAFRENQGSTDATKAIERQVDRAETATRIRPRDPAAWAQLTRLRYQSASIGSGYDQSTGRFTGDGLAKLRLARRSWNRYLALDPPRPDDRLASLMAQALGPAGLNDADGAVRAQEIVAEERRPATANLYAQLANLAWMAGQNRKGDLAADKAVSLTDRGERTLMRQQLDQAKTVAQQAATGSTTTPSG